MRIASTVSHVACTLVLTLSLSACKRVGGIDSSLILPISNNDAIALLGYLWGGARSAIAKEREPSTSPFSLALTYALPCTRGGTGSYQGTLAGAKSAGTGSATLAVTGTLSGCQFDNTVSVTAVSAASVGVTGTIAVANDTWSTINLHMVAGGVTVNGVACPGGVDVVLSGTAPSGQVTSTGTVCNLTGAVPVP